MSSKNVQDLFYFKSFYNFAQAIDSKYIYGDRQLLQKLKDSLFFYTLEAEIAPSYNFWPKILGLIINFPSFSFADHPKYVTQWIRINEDFQEHAEKHLRDFLVRSLTPWRCFPIMFRDFYDFYPRFNLKFEEIEFIYLDFWSQLPKVLDSLLGELLVRDNPIVEEIPGTNEFLIWWTEASIFPAKKVASYSREELHNHVINYFLSENKNFFKVLVLYLESRTVVKKQCSLDLQAKGVEVNETSLVEYFVGYHIFKDVSLEGLRFCAANLDLNNKDFFKPFREAAIKEWNNFSEEVRKKIINRHQKYLVDLTKKVQARLTLSHEERVADHWKRDAEINEMMAQGIPSISIPKVLVEAFVKKE